MSLGGLRGLLGGFRDVATGGFGDGAGAATPAAARVGNCGGAPSGAGEDPGAGPLVEAGVGVDTGSAGAGGAAGAGAAAGGGGEASAGGAGAGAGGLKAATTSGL